MGIIDSAAQNAELLSYLTSNFSTCDKFYIGLYPDAYGGWLWPMAGWTYDSSSYVNFKSGYPVNSSSATCVVLNKDGTWSNQECDSPQYYICSY